MEVVEDWVHRTVGMCSKEPAFSFSPSEGLERCERVSQAERQKGDVCILDRARHDMHFLITRINMGHMIVAFT